MIVNNNQLKFLIEDQIIKNKEFSKKETNDCKKQIINTPSKINHEIKKEIKSSKNSNNHKFLSEGLTSSQIENSENLLKFDNNDGNQIKKQNDLLNENTNSCLKNNKGNSTMIFQSVKSDKLERDLISKIIDDKIFKKTIFENSNLIKSIKENENKNISLNLNIELNLNLFPSEKDVINSKEYKMETFSKENFSNNKKEKQTDYILNLPVFNDLNLKNHNEDLNGIFDKICNDLKREIRENQSNDSPKRYLIKDLKRSSLFNLDKTHYTFEYMKNKNNKIESECLLEFLNFIDFNLKNTITNDNNAYKLYSKYEFLTNNLVDKEDFFKILNNSNDKNIYDIKHDDSGVCVGNKDLILDFFSMSENEKKRKIFSQSKDESNLNTNKNLSNVPPTKNNLFNLNNENIIKISSSDTKNKSKGKIEENHEKIKSFNQSNNLINNWKTTINSQDIDIINDLQLNKNNINLNKNKSPSGKIFKSSIDINFNKDFENNINNIVSPKIDSNKRNPFNPNNDVSNLDELNNNYQNNLNKISNEQISLNQNYLIPNIFSEKIEKNDKNTNDLGNLNNYTRLGEPFENELFLLNSKKYREIEETIQKNENQCSIPQNMLCLKYQHVLNNNNLFDSLNNENLEIAKIISNIEYENYENYENENSLLYHSNLCENDNNSRLNRQYIKERKFKTDSIHKKIKVNILKFIKDYIIDHAPNIKLPNLSQEIVTNVNISYNKELLEKKIIEIYQEDFDSNNKEALESILNIMATNQEFNNVMLLKLKDFIEEKYLNSEYHKNKLKSIYEKESQEYYMNYLFLDKDFINYYLNNRGNRKIIKK